MKWSIHQLNKSRNKGLKFDETVDLGELSEWNNDIRGIAPVHVSGNAEFNGTKVTFHLHIETTLILPCSRTLVDVEYPIDLHVNEIFDLSPSDYEDEDSDDIHSVTGETLDLIPYIRENILLEVPMQVFSEDPDSEEMAPQSGKDWQVVTEEQKEQQVDPRLAELKKFFDD